MLTEGETDFDFAFRCASCLVGAVFGLEPSLLVGEKKGSPAVVHARQVFMYLLYTEGPGYGSVAIARAAGRHHSTVLHSIEKITAMREDQDLDAALSMLGAMFRQLVEAHSRLPEMVEVLAA